MVQSSFTPSGATELPRLAADHLARPRLQQPLLQTDCRLRLLCAPAGSGKSLLLSECLRQCPSETQLVYLDLHGQPLAAERLAQLLANALGGDGADPASVGQLLHDVPGPLWLVIDDYPRAPDEQLDGYLNSLIQAAPRRVCWWLASRRRPALQLVRLLLDGELFELGARELAFSANELAELLQEKHLYWPKPTIDELQRDAQGWCAGIRLHLLNLSSGQAPTGLLRNDPRLLDYLKCEVLDELPEDWRQALQTLALLAHFDVALCEQLLGMGEGAQWLEKLCACGLFIEKAGLRGQLFRVQPMVAQALARQLPDALAKAVYRKTCQWYINQDQLRPALEYAVKAGQMDVAASLMQRYTEDFILQGRSLAQLLEWRRELPQELLYSTPRLVLLNAWVLLLSGRLDEAQCYSDRLAQFLPQPTASRQRELLGQWQALHAQLAFHRGDSQQAHTLLNAALTELAPRAWSQRLLCQALQVEQALNQGQLDLAQALNRSATKQAREHTSLALESVMVLGHVKLLEIRGELLRAENLLSRLHSELSAAWGGEASPMRGRVQLRQANLLMQQGHYPQAESSFHSGLQEARTCCDPAALWGYLGLAELDALQGDFSSAFSRIADGERFMQYNHISESLYQGLLLRTKALLWLMQGRSAQAEQALLDAPRLELSPYGAPELQLRLRLLLLQAQLANGAIEQAREALATLHTQALVEGRRALACEVGFSLAEALYASNRPGQGKQSLLDAITQARQMGLVNSERAFARRCPTLMHALNKKHNDEAPVALLSRRELEVLKLIVRGLSNQQIGEALFISLHTVKTHTQRIHCKLGVERRTQAVARAKELGLG